MEPIEPGLTHAELAVEVTRASATDSSDVVVMSFIVSIVGW